MPVKLDPNNKVKIRFTGLTGLLQNRDDMLITNPEYGKKKPIGIQKLPVMWFSPLYGSGKCSLHHNDNLVAPSNLRVPVEPEILL